MLMAQRALAVGCFWFGVAPSVDKIDASEHFKLLLEQLEAIPNISDLKHSGLAAENLKHQLTSDRSNDREDTFYPHYTGLRLQFDLYIPQRVQNNLMPLRARESRAGSEHFRVLMYYEYHAPITLISYDTERQDVRPADAVMFVREYLEAEFRDAPVSFRYLGPSPFHANFFFQQSAGTVTFSDLSSSLGYKKYVISYPSDYDGVEYFVDEFSDFFAIYYRLVLYNSSIRNESIKVSNALADLLKLHNRGDLRGWVQKHGTTSRRISGIASMLLNLEAIRLRKESFVATCRLDKRTKEDLPITYFIEKATVSDIELPTENIRQMLNFFESRQLKNFEAIVLFLTAILGGVVGSLLTAIFG